MNDKRHQPRANIALNVEITQANSIESNHRTQNIGLGGMFVDLGEEPGVPEIGTEVDIQFAGDAPYRMKARVSRVTENGMALVFREFKFEDFMFLEEPMRQQRLEPISMMCH